jgi:glucokinase
MQIDQKLIGVDLGGTNMRVGMVEGNCIANLATMNVNKNGTAGDILVDLCCLIEKIFDKNTAGIGIGVPSVIDVEKGIVYDVGNIPQWKEVHLKDILERRFNLPVYVNNDANCFAAGEKFYGKGLNSHSFIGLIIGTGLGAGVVINDKVYEGRNCGAGEFGCIPYKDFNYEYYCSGQFFSNMYNISAHEAAKLAIQGDKDAIKMYEEYGAHLGKAIHTILYAYDPELIVLGGSVSKSFNLFKDSLYQSLDSFLFNKTIRNLKIEVSEIQNIAIFGAASLYYNSLVEAI